MSHLTVHARTTNGLLRPNLEPVATPREVHAQCQRGCPLVVYEDRLPDLAEDGHPTTQHGRFCLTGVVAEFAGAIQLAIPPLVAQASSTGVICLRGSLGADGVAAL